MLIKIFRINKEDWPNGVPAIIAIVRAGLAKTTNEAKRFIKNNTIWVMTGLGKWELVSTKVNITEKHITNFENVFGGNIVLAKGKAGKTVGSGRLKPIHWEI